MATPEVSLVVTACNEGDNLTDTVASVIETGSSLAFEVVVVDDGSTDGSGERAAAGLRDHDCVSHFRTDGIGVAAARNLGARRSRGRTLVFLDAHCWCPPGWLEALVAPLADRGVGLAGPAFTDLVHDDSGVGCGVGWPKPDLQMSWLPVLAGGPRPVPLMPGGCDAIRRDLFFEIGGYDSGMGRWGSEGEELSLRVWSRGREVQGVPGCVLRHLFRPRHPYAVDAAAVLHNRLRMATVHFRDDRLRRVLDALRGAPAFAEALVRLSNSDAAERRSRQSAEQRRNLDGWFDRFASDW